MVESISKPSSQRSGDLSEVICPVNDNAGTQLQFQDFFPLQPPLTIARTPFPTPDERISHY